MILCTLKIYMKENKKTQTQVAKETGLNRPTLFQLINNENKNVKYETVEALCRYFNITINDLLIYSPINIAFCNVEIDKVKTSKDIETYKIVASYKFNDEVYQFSGSVEMKNNEVIYENFYGTTIDSISLTCSITKEKYIKLIEDGFDENFFDQYNELFDIRNIIYNHLSIKNSHDIYFRFNIDGMPNVFEVMNNIRLLTGSEKELIQAYLRDEFKL
ncbi:hypothetical protein CW683_02325 [Macrococcoides caseolyticum]|nr:hypothetical protein CW683_02325 [Macrococcus caseolyticus]